FSSLRGLRPLRHVKPMLSYLIMSVGKGMANNADVTVLGFAGTVETVGVYQIASKVKNMVVAAVDSVGSVLLPRLTSYKTSGNDGLLEPSTSCSQFCSADGLLCIVRACSMLPTYSRYSWRGALHGGSRPAYRHFTRSPIRLGH